jgi:16S rRNA processing protein RimM
MADDFPYSSEQFLLIGKIIEPHGLKGEVVIFSFSGQPENIQQYPRLYLVSPSGKVSQPQTIEKSRIKGKTLIARLHSISDRSQAESLVGMGVLISKADLPQPGENEFYLYRMEGLPVFTMEGRRLGTVAHIFSNGAQDLLVVRDGKNEYMIPVLDSIIKSHDGEKIVIDAPPGLLEINSAPGDECPWTP